jgi:hypothetical protein
MSEQLALKQRYKAGQPVGNAGEWLWQ